MTEALDGFEIVGKPAASSLNQLVLVLAESNLGTYRLVHILREAGAQGGEEYFVPSIITKLEESIEEYATALANEHASSSGVWAAVVRIQHLAKVPLGKIGVGANCFPKYIWLKANSVSTSAAELYLDQRAPDWQSSNANLNVSNLPMPDLHTFKAMVAQAGSNRALIKRYVAAKGANTLEVSVEELLDNPGEVAAKVNTFLALDASLTLAKSDNLILDRLVAQRAAVDVIVNHGQCLSQVNAVTLRREPKKLASDDPQVLAIVMMVKDEEDIIFANLTWHFAMGARQFLIMDNLSTDSTRAEIDRFIRLSEPLGARVLVIDEREEGYYQSRKTTAAAHLAKTYFGAEWVIALDADEFIYISHGDLYSVLARGEKQIENELGISRLTALFTASIQFQLIDHFCTASDSVGEPNPIVRMPFRRRKAKGGYKTAARWDSSLVFGQGNHVVNIVGGGMIPAVRAGPFGAHIRHFPVRSFDHFRRKVINGGKAYLKAPDLSPKTGQHWREWYKVFEQQGESALRQLFDENFVARADELQFDPLPRVICERGGIYLDRGSRNQATIDIPLHGEQVLSIGGIPFVPEIISLRVPPALQPVSLRMNTSDIPTFLQVFARAEYDIEFIQVPEYIVDLGANIGLAAAYFTGRFPEAKIICVEPNNENFKILLQNTNGYSNVITLCAAVWHESGNLEIVESDDAGKPLGFWGTQTRAFSVEGSASITLNGNIVPAMTVPEIMKAANFPRIDLLKVDIEGAELELFTGDTSEWLPLIGQLVIETHDRFRPGSTAAVRSAMVRLGFEESKFGENLSYVRRD